MGRIPLEQLPPDPSEQREISIVTLEQLMVLTEGLLTTLHNAHLESQQLEEMLLPYLEMEREGKQLTGQEKLEVASILVLLKKVEGNVKATHELIDSAYKALPEGAAISLSKTAAELSKPFPKAPTLN